MNYSTLNITENAHITHIELSRPQAYNAMNRAFWREFPAALRQVRDSSDTRALVISSTGKHFSAGMDLEVFSQPDPRLFSGEAARRGEFVRRLVLDLQDIFNQIEDLRIPVLAAIQGGCIGGALDLICACDCRYCTDDAFFTVKETELGMTADLGTLQRLPGLVGPGLARELAYTARKLSAAEAHSSGLVNATFTDTTSMLEGVMTIARQIASHSPIAVSGSKAMINYARDHSVADSLKHMATWQAGMFQPADMMEVFAAKTQKREPEFKPLNPVEPPFSED